MLNKLLKRCMPWQQRGKWARIYIDWTDTDNAPLVKGPDWLNVSVVDAGHGEYSLNYNPDDYYCLLDQRLMITERIISEGETPSKVYAPSTDLYEVYRKKGYIDLFLSIMKVTIEG